MRKVSFPYDFYLDPIDQMAAFLTLENWLYFSHISIIVIIEKHVSKDECMILNDILGIKTLSGCYAMNRNDLEDNFTIPGENKFEGKDAQLYRNSWLMPRMARRLTRNNKHHVSNWRQDPIIDDAECARLRLLLTNKLDTSEQVHINLPKACRDSKPISL